MMRNFAPDVSFDKPRGSRGIFGCGPMIAECDASRASHPCHTNRKAHGQDAHATQSHELAARATMAKMRRLGFKKHQSPREFI